MNNSASEIHLSFLNIHGKHTHTTPHISLNGMPQASRQVLAMCCSDFGVRCGVFGVCCSAAPGIPCIIPGKPGIPLCAPAPILGIPGGIPGKGGAPDICMPGTPCIPGAPAVFVWAFLCVCTCMCVVLKVKLQKGSTKHFVPSSGACKLSRQGNSVMT